MAVEEREPDLDLDLGRSLLLEEEELELSRAEELRSEFARLDEELETLRRTLPEVGNRVRGSEAKVQQQALFIDAFAEQLRCSEAAIHESSARRQQAELRCTEKSEEARALRDALRACQAALEGKTAESADLPSIHLEVRTVKAQIESERRQFGKLEDLSQPLCASLRRHVACRVQEIETRKKAHDVHLHEELTTASQQTDEELTTPSQQTDEEAESEEDANTETSSAMEESPRCFKQARSREQSQPEVQCW